MKKTRSSLLVRLVAATPAAALVLGLSLLGSACGTKMAQSSSSESASEPIAELPIDAEVISAADVDQKPEVIGGPAAINRHLAKHLKYPEDAANKGASGRVIVSFVVEKDGSLSNFRVTKSSGNHSLDLEAIRVIKLFKKFKPGMHQGKPVRVQFSQPVVFKLNNYVQRSAFPSKMLLEEGNHLRK